MVTKSEISCRSGAIDIVRVLAMLSIIEVHSSLTEPLWNIYCAFLEPGPGVMYFFFLAALFTKPDTLLVYKRAGWLFGCFLFWGVMTYMLLSPVTSWLTGCISGEMTKLVWPSLMDIPLNHILQWDMRKVFPHYGVLWFLRLLLLLSIVSPFLMRLPRYVLVVLGCAFFSVRYTCLVTSPEYSEYLPFVLTAGWPSASVAVYLFGLALNKAGGLKLCLHYGRRLFPLAAVICMCQLIFIFTGYKGILADEILIMVPFALCSLIMSLERFGFVQKVGGFVSRHAACIFTVYILHSRFNSVVYAAGDAWFDGAVLRGYHMLMPVLVFGLCWLMYLALVRIPHCSMLLCFVPRKKV